LRGGGVVEIDQILSIDFLMKNRKLAPQGLNVNTGCLSARGFRLYHIDILALTKRLVAALWK